MKYSLFVLATIVLTSCSYSSGVSDTQSITVNTGSSTVQAQDPYTIGTVDTAFKLI